MACEPSSNTVKSHIEAKPLLSPRHYLFALDMPEVQILAAFPAMPDCIPNPKILTTMKPSIFNFPRTLLPSLTDRPRATFLA